MAGRSPRADRQGFGRWSEEVATRYLQSLGYTILARNFWCEAGEADIVAREGDALVIVEVRARSSAVYGTPAESVTPAKARRLALVLEAYRFQHPDCPPASRIDFVGITMPRGARSPIIELIRNAVEDGFSG